MRNMVRELFKKPVYYYCRCCDGHHRVHDPSAICYYCAKLFRKILNDQSKRNQSVERM